MASTPRSLVRLAVIGVLPLLALTSMSGTANAAGQSHTSTLGSAGGSFSTTISKSPSFAGYISQKKHIKSVLATLEVPFIKKCPSTADGGMGPVVIVGGKKYFVGAGAEASCRKGTTTYQIAVNYNGSESKFLSVKPKDEITVYVTVGAKKTTVVIDDLTSKQKISKDVPAGVPTYADLGDDTLVDSSTNKQLPIPPFSDHRFTGVKINGRALGTATPLSAQELVLRKTVLILPGALSAKGTAFTMIFKNAG